MASSGRAGLLLLVPFVVVGVALRASRTFAGWSLEMVEYGRFWPATRLLLPFRLREGGPFRCAARAEASFCSRRALAFKRLISCDGHQHEI